MKPFVTMDDFEEISDTVEQIDMEHLFYSIEDIKEQIEPDLKKSLPFAIRLSQQKPQSEQEKKARSYLLNLLNQTIIFDD